MIALSACSKDNSMFSMPDIDRVKTKLAFTCAHEVNSLPPVDSHADEIFNYARYLEKQRGEKDYNEIARYYRIAAAYDHYKANHNLQKLVSEGWAHSPHPQRESVELATKLVAQGIPVGYFDIGYYISRGYGFKQDQEMALRYFRKAADLGNADAQYYVADKLSPWNMAPDVAQKMYQCAIEQGHGEAAEDWGISLQDEKQYGQATQTFQKGVSAGSSLSALLLKQAFGIAQSEDQLGYLDLPYDAERSHRYELIGAFLNRNDGRNPKVPDIDDIVPLPPAPLPAWDGSFQWEKEQQVVPPKPSEDLMKRLCKDKQLDPATGLPLPLPPKTALGTRVKTGEACPETGKWCVWSNGRVLPYAASYCHKGQSMPVYEKWQPRRFGLLDGFLPFKFSYWNVEWQLVDYS